MDYVKFGAVVRKTRKARHWTQARLAKEVRLSISFLGHIERGTRIPSLETLVALANSLKVPAGVLLADSLLPLPPDRLNKPMRRKQNKGMLRQMAGDLERWV
jgi:transcriptional regulator with XRE-family HTH domain